MAMFNVGDKVVYPMHGAGVIEAVEEREILGEKQSYYILRIPNGDMRVMVPLESAEEVGLRGVIDKEDVQRSTMSWPGIGRKCHPTGIEDTGLTWKRLEQATFLKWQR